MSSKLNEFVGTEKVIPQTETTGAFWKWISDLPKPYSLTEHCHDGKIKSCCQMAAFQLQKMAEAIDARSGVAGIFQNACTFLKFGPSRPRYLCQAIDQRLQLDYGPSAVLIKRLLSYCRDVIDSSIQPISVSYLGLSTPEQREIWREIFNGSCTDWIFGPIYYRECIGLVSKSGSISVWNFDHWMSLNHSTQIPENGGVLAWRFEGGSEKFGIDHPISFDGTSIPISLNGDHFYTLPEHTSILEACISKISLSIPDHPIDGIDIPTIFVSGIYCNGDCPGAGVGIARCLRKAFSNSVKLIGVDNSIDSGGLHDPVFDDIFVFGTPFKENAIDHFNCVLALLEKYPRSLYLSGEEIELRILAECISDQTNRFRLSTDQISRKTKSDHPSITPDHADRPLITPDHADRPSITPDHADRPSITPDHADRPSITPDHADRPRNDTERTDQPENNVERTDQPENCSDRIDQLQNHTDYRNYTDHTDQKRLFRRILIPSKLAIDQTTKPFMPILKNQLPSFQIPPSFQQIDGESDDDFIERAQPFLHTCSFPVIIKSLYYGAILANSFLEVKNAVKGLRSHWKKSIYIQESIFGFEETIMFTAFEGKILGEPVLMRKTMMTPKGKAWAATITKVLPPEITDQMTEILEKLNWTGGGELEYIRTLDDQKYAIDWNLRFPSWVYGAALESENLPGSLISAAFMEIFELKLKFEEPEKISIDSEMINRKDFDPIRNFQKYDPGWIGSGKWDQKNLKNPEKFETGFIRTVIEVPWSRKIQPSILRGPEFLTHNIFGDVTYARSQQHPSRQSSMAGLLHKYLEKNSADQKKIDSSQGHPNLSIDFGQSEPGSNVGYPSNKKSMETLPSPAETLKMHSTPCRHLNIPVLDQTIQKFKKIVDQAAISGSSGRIQSSVALSIKTQPDPQILKEALKFGYVADAISVAELDLAIKCGFKSDQLIMNGPCKFWLRGNLIDEKLGNEHRFLAIFADSVSEFEKYSHKLCTSGSVIGVRLAMPGTGTRFGIDISDRNAIDRLGKCLLALPEGVKIGFHFHYASSDLGLKTWFNLCRLFVTTCHAIISMNHLNPEIVTLIDFGGGFVPISDQVQAQFEKGLAELFAFVDSELPHVTRVILEPGKTLSLQPVTLITRVLEIREPVQHQIRVGQSPVRAIIVDACLGDGRLIPTQYRQVFALSGSGGEWKTVDRGGTDIVLGRLCMEIDVLLSGLQLPHDLKIGDYLAVANAGAYEASAAYPFGEGYQCGNALGEQ